MERILGCTTALRIWKPSAELSNQTFVNQPEIALSALKSHQARQKTQSVTFNRSTRSHRETSYPLFT